MIIGKINESHFSENGNPAGGFSTATGITIVWQNGPGGVQTGAVVEQVIQIALGRLNYYQETKFACKENADAIAYLAKALGRLNSRTEDRIDRGVEGTHVV